MNSSTIQQSSTERFITGVPAAEAVAGEAVRRNARRIFIVSDETLQRQTDEIRKVEEALGDRHAHTYAGITAHAPIEQVIDGVAVAREAQADLIVTIGGGSITDAGKIMAIGLKANVRSMHDLPRLMETYKWGRDGEDAAGTAPDVKVIAVPTTLAGAELNFIAGANHATLGKIGFQHVANAPATVVYDPWITRHTPEWLWLSTGVRSIDHAVETLASLRSSEYFDAVAETALRLLVNGLMRIRRDPEDVEARQRCQIGTWQSMIGLLNGVPMGASHAIGQTLGGVTRVPHGHTSCVLLPAVQKWNAQAIPDRLRRVSAALGDETVPAHELLDQLIRGLGQPRRLDEVGVGLELWDSIVDRAMAHQWTKTNPRLIKTEQDILEILEIAAAPFA